MRKSGDGQPSGHNIYWFILTATVAAAIPIVTYLIITRERSELRHQEEVPGESVSADLERLADKEHLYRDSVAVDMGGGKLFEAVDIRKVAGEDHATARRMFIHLPLFFEQSRESLDNTLVKLFSALPPGTTSLRSAQFEVHLTAPFPGSSKGVVWDLSGEVALEQKSVRIAGSWNFDNRECFAQFIYTLTSGLVFAKYQCPGAPPAPAPFLPEGQLISFDSLVLTGGSHLKLDKVAVVDGADGSTVFAADGLTFDASRSVDREVFSSGLSQRLLAREKNWRLEVTGVQTAFAQMVRLPPFSGFPSLPDAAFTATAIEADSAGNLRLVAPRLHWQGIAGFEAAKVEMVTEDGAIRFSVESPRVEADQWGISISSETAAVEQDEYQTLWLKVDGFSIGLPLNPLKLRGLLDRLRAFKGELKGLLQEPVDKLPPLLVEEFPDVRLSLSGGKLSLPVPGAGQVSKIEVEIDLVGGTIARARAGFCAGTRDCDEVGFSAEVRSDAAGRPNKLHLNAKGRRVAGALMEVVPEFVTGLGNADIACETVVEGAGPRLKSDCKVVLERITLKHKRLAGNSFTVPLLRVEGEARIDLGQNKLELSLPQVQIGEVYFRMALDLLRFRGLPEVRLKVDFPEQNCAAFLRSVPGDFAPLLQEASLTGSLWFNVEFKVDMQDLRKTIKLEFDGDLDRCEALSLGPGLDVSKLNSPDYVHRVVVKGEDLGVDVGPGTPGWVPLHYVPKVVQAAAYGTEDLAFFRHNGFRTGLIRRAVILYLERGRFAYGGSTISQQLVKNLFLNRKKTLSRKFQEAVIVWDMEKQVSKERILELYLNCIEYGPKIWGISKAAATYFGKTPGQINAMEAAFIMGLKPDPKYGYLQYRRGKLNKHWRKNLDRVLKRLVDMEALSYTEYDRYMRLPLKFRRKGPAPPAVDGLQEQEDRPVRTGQEEL